MAEAWVRAQVPKKSKAHPQIRGSDSSLRGTFMWGLCFGSIIGGLSKYPLQVLYALGRVGRGNTEKARASVPQPWHAPTNYEPKMGAHMWPYAWRVLEWGLDIRINYAKHKKSAKSRLMLGSSVIASVGVRIIEEYLGLIEIG